SASIAADHRNLACEVLTKLERCGVQRPALVAIDETRAPLWAKEVVEGYQTWCTLRGIVPVKLQARVMPDDEVIARLLENAEQLHCDALLWVAQGIVPHALALQARGVGAGLQLAAMAAEPGPPRVV